MHETIHLVIKEIMNERGVLLKDICEETGIATTTLNRFFRGSQALSHDRFLTLLESLGIDVYDIVRSKYRGNALEKRSLKAIIKEIGEYLTIVNPNRVKPMLRTLMNHAAKTKGVDKDKLARLREEYFRG